MKKLVVLIALLMAIAIISSVSSEDSSYRYLSLENRYSIGDTVNIRLENISDVELSVISENNIYRYVGDLDKELSFFPRNLGNYSVEIINKTSSELLQIENFVVIEPTEKLTVFSDKKHYLMGEDVRIYIEDPKNRNYTLTVKTGKDEFGFLGKTTPLFKPPRIGNYSIHVLDEDNHSWHYNFSVSSSFEQLPNHVYVKTDKKKYLLGEQVVINFSGNYTLTIISDNVYEFLGLTEAPLFFNPKILGNYTIKLRRANQTLAATVFEVVENRTVITKNATIPIHRLTEDISVLFDFSQHVNQTIIEKLLGMSPFKTASTFVLNYTDDPNFNFTITKYRNHSFRSTLHANPNIEEGIYTIIFVAETSKNTFIKNYTFRWIDTAESIKENISGKPKSIANHSFVSDQAAFFIIDFGSEISKERTFIDNALKRSLLDELTVYVEDNDNFNISIEHIVYDSFKIELEEKDKIRPDIYDLIIVAKAENQIIQKRINFSWNLDQILEQVNKTKRVINKTNIIIQDSDNLRISYNVSFFREGKQVKSIDYFLLYDAEIKLNSPINRIVFSDLNMSGTLILSIDTLSDIEGPENSIIKKAYAIDASQLNFTSAIASKISAGDELWKCTDWNFTEKECIGVWTKVKKIEVGDEYDITLTRNSLCFFESHYYTLSEDFHNTLYKDNITTAAWEGGQIRANKGDSRFKNYSFAQSLAYDTNLSDVSYAYADINQHINGQSVLWEFSDSADNLTFSDWTQNISALRRRYIRFKVHIYANHTQSPLIHNITISYAPASESKPHYPKLECQIDNQSWVECSKVLYNTNLKAVRSYCGAEDSVTDVSFRLKNIPDNYTYFFENSNYQIAGFWIYEIPDLRIEDSGEFILEAVCYEANSVNSSHYNWTIPWGRFEVEISDDDLILFENDRVPVQSLIRCVGGECGDAKQIVSWGK
jgi:hypothetical protein